MFLEPIENENEKKMARLANYAILGLFVVVGIAALL